MSHEHQPERHFWLPVPDSGDLVRHAFRGRRWENQPADDSVCGRRLAMAQPCELDWCRAPTCPDCNDTLKNERP
ncbi:hypothetical protein [Saccharopolyspora gregorii]|uniref:Uncharacterized protein n=1 Tax=Saccharopolyspora gregorii TaxID=33914 RepID=A0ABP6RKP3_9PSEU